MNFEEAMQFLESSARFGMRFGLTRTIYLLEELGNPQNQYRILHVAGTNGKGSTCAFAASMLKEAGAKVGLYTSPHLIRINERIQVNGEEISNDELAEGLSWVKNISLKIESTEGPVTYFEICTAVALWYFAQKKVEFAVLETGLGGKLDSTNAVSSHVAAITRIGLDHMALLGGDLAAIAREKAGIFKKGARVVVGRQEPQVKSVLWEEAQKNGETPSIAGSDFFLNPSDDADSKCFQFSNDKNCISGIYLSLLGPHQRENAEIAIQSVAMLYPGIKENFIREGLRKASWPGRMEVVENNPLTIFDGAHNPDGARALVIAIQAHFPRHRVHLVFGALADKDVKGIVSVLFPVAKQVYLTSPRCERAMTIEELVHRAEEVGASSISCHSVSEAIIEARKSALDEGEEGLVLVAGSLYLVGEAKSYWESKRSRTLGA